jgi:hypothetical protein
VPLTLRGSAGVCCVLLPLVASYAGAAQSAVQPVSVVVISVAGDPFHQVVEYAIVNNTNVTITAWNVGLLIRKPDGGSTGYGEGADAYLAYAGLVSDADYVVRSHATVRRSIALDTPGVGIADVEITLQCAIFADATWIGTEADVDRFFERRQANFEAEGEILRILRTARANGSGPDALRAALRDLSRPDQKDFANGNKQMMRRNLERLLQPRTGVSPDDELAGWILSHEARLQSADAHRHKGAARRSSRPLA